MTRRQRSQPPDLMRRGFEKEKLMEGRKGRRKGESNRILITVTVPGSAGQIRFVVREKELVEAVIGTLLKSYAREGRLPVLGSDFNDFVLYSAYDGFDGALWLIRLLWFPALNPIEPIGGIGGRNFVLCRKQVLAGEEKLEMAGKEAVKEAGKKGKCGWKAWLNKSLSFRVSPR
ncbi:hypothetical protein KSP39_PZI015714 [Platanthera zijinensis]|uniref:DUF7054 domain-containing protein n=1 Tax=Platanthera zijinensis TaxID=2320716 RepID=A0AAP0G1S8_9ASPA